MPQIQPPAQALTNGDAGRRADPTHGSEVGKDEPEKNTRMHTLCRETMSLNTDRAGIFGVSFVDLNVKAPCGRQVGGSSDAGHLRGGGRTPREESSRKDRQRRERSAA